MKFFRKKAIFKFFVCLLCFLHTPLWALDSQLFHKKLKEPTPTWMREQIEHDLAPFQKELSKDYLDKLFARLQEDDENKENWYLVRIKVSNNHLTVEKSHRAESYELSNVMVEAFHKLQRMIRLPNLDLILTSCDVRWPHILPLRRGDPCTPVLPIFSLAKHKKDPGLILIPDWYAFEDFHPSKLEIFEGNQLYNWKSKLPVLFFRGADSGVYERTNWRSCGRPTLVAYSLQYPKLIDAKFHYLHHYEVDSSIRDTMKKEGMVGDFVPLSQFCRYKYLVDVDGHTANTPRVALFLHSNSVLFKQVSEEELWFFTALKPNIHFIPVSHDLSDLLSQLAWAKSHDAECEAIVKNANQFAKENLSAESIYLYLYRLLEGYSSKQKSYYN